MNRTRFISCGKKIKKIGFIKLFFWGVFFSFVLTLLSFFILLINTLVSTKKLYSVVLNNQTEEFPFAFNNWQKLFSIWDVYVEKINWATKGKLKTNSIFFSHWSDLKSLVGYLPQILGQDREKIYLVLLQNDRELRPTGGFLGSYAKLKFEKGGLSSVAIQDIYIPDGQLPGHVEPPTPIQEAFKQGWWKLRDANWDPDYPQAAKVIDWFFVKGGEEESQGILALNFSFFEQLLEIFGAVNLPQYQTIVDKSNFYQIAQSYSEVNFFPGSSQKKDILSNLGWAFLDQARSLNKSQLVKIFSLISQDLRQRQILFYFKDPLIQEVFANLEWDGGMQVLPQSNEKEVFDYLYLVESNLGANKANCCVEREVELGIDFFKKDLIKNSLKIVFNNQSPYYTPQPPIFWGGDYLNYFRVYVPKDAENFTVFIDKKALDNEKITFEEKNEFGLKGIGFFVKVPHQSRVLVEINYQQPQENKDWEKYTLLLQKQPGLKSTPFLLEVNSPFDFNFDKKMKEFLISNTELKGNLEKDKDINILLNQ